MVVTVFIWAFSTTLTGMGFKAGLDVAGVGAFSFAGNAFMGLMALPTMVNGTTSAIAGGTFDAVVGVGVLVAATPGAVQMVAIIVVTSGAV